MAVSMTGLAEEFVDACGDPNSLPDFPPTFETLTRVRSVWDFFLIPGLQVPKI
jgi:hypothetical protein